MSPRLQKVPLHYAGMRIGLMGGSFDPAHAGHLHCARQAMRRLRLHQVWWLVSPQNPLKTTSAPLQRRLESALRVGRDRRIVVTAFEAHKHLAFTVDTLAALAPQMRGVRLVWVMGEDAMANFHLWRRWRAILGAVPIAIVPRPGAGPRERGAKAFATHAHRRTAPGRLMLQKPPVWALLGGPRHAASSTAIRLGKAGESR